MQTYEYPPCFEEPLSKASWLVYVCRLVRRHLMVIVHILYLLQTNTQLLQPEGSLRWMLATVFILRAYCGVSCQRIDSRPPLPPLHEL